MYFATGAPTSILIHLQEEWRFSPGMMSVAYAAYPAGLLVSMPFLGALSDFVGRRPVLIVALVAQAVAVAGFILSPDIVWFTMARILQGFTIGAGASAFTAYVVEAAPLHRKRLGSVLGSLGPTAALGVGGLVGGLAVQFAPHPVAWTYWPILALTIFSAMIVALSAETITRVPGATRSMIPTLAVPVRARRSFKLLVPLLACSWMIPGLYLGLGPVIIRDIFQFDSGLLYGIAALVQPVAAVAFGVAFGGSATRNLVRAGGWFSVIGAGSVLVSVVTGLMPLFLIAGVFCGLAFGLTLSAIVAHLMPLARDHERAGLLAVMYLIGYFSFAASSVVAGQLITPAGALATVVGYATVIMGFAAFGVVLVLRLPSPGDRNAVHDEPPQ